MFLSPMEFLLFLLTMVSFQVSCPISFLVSLEHVSLEFSQEVCCGCLLSAFLSESSWFHEVIPLILSVLLKCLILISFSCFYQFQSYFFRRCYFLDKPQLLVYLSHKGKSIILPLICGHYSKLQLAIYRMWMTSSNVRNEQFGKQTFVQEYN